MNKEKIIVESTILADRKKVWDFYTNSKHIIKWNFASDDWHCPKAENDLKKGGKYYSRMEAKDGSFGFDFEAIYEEVIVGEKFIYTLGDGRKVTVNFEPLDKTTKVIVSFDAETENPIAMQKNGWQAILNNFKKYSENN
ncbi:MAG: SRPBCC family protein [Bacteroidia bacterium]